MEAKVENRRVPYLIKIPVECYQRTVGYYAAKSMVNKGIREQINERHQYHRADVEKAVNVSEKGRYTGGYFEKGLSDLPKGSPLAIGIFQEDIEGNIIEREQEREVDEIS